MMCQRNDDTALLMPAIDIPVGRDYLFQGIDPINDRFKLACFGKLF